MFKRIFTILLVMYAVAFGTGCSTMADAKNAQGTGTAKEYSASFDTVWKTLPGVLTEISLPLASENKQDGYMLAQRGVTLLSTGENVAIFVKPIPGQARTQVEVVSKKAIATDLFAPNWANRIHEKLAEKLK